MQKSQSTTESNSQLKNALMLLPLLASIVAIAPLAIDMYLPAMPTIAKDLNTNINTVQNSLSIYLAGYALGMMIFGPTADRIGRRKVVIIGLIGFIIFSVALAFAKTADQFLTLRFFQAMISSGATVVVPGVIRDMYGKHTAKGLSYVSMIMMVAPMIAPAIGTFILHFTGWRSIFIVLAAYAVLILGLVIWKLPNSMPSNKDRNWLAEFATNYKTVFAHKIARFDIFTSMFVSFCFFCYLTAISFIYIEYFKASEQMFSLLFGLNVGSLLITNFINSRLVERFGSPKLLKIGMFLSLFWAIVLFSLVQMDFGLYWIAAAIIFLLSGLSFTATNADALILTKFAQQSGTATAVIGTLRFGSGALAGPLLALLFVGTPSHFAWLVFGSVICVLIVQLMKQRALKQLQ